MRVWLGPFDASPVATAQVPNAGLQRNLLLAEAQRTNQLLTEIKQALDALPSQTLTMRTAAEAPAKDDR